MIDAPGLAVLVGSAIQAAPAATRVVAAIRPRAAAFVAALRATPLPPTDTELEQLIASID